MRVAITGEAESVGALALDGSSLQILSVEPTRDDTEQQFGLAELAIVVAVVKSAAELAESLHTWWARRKSPRTQTLRMSTSIGRVTIELSEDVTVDDLRQALTPLFAALP
ncbi:hypothetical protein [Cellulomonas sp. URHD0024]|uniref:hypothetical protein n=1 Tax=Cellulomonas sp. URHD0024 TaxID=1302620 RepID=UPI0003F627C3|nr:hypothetical protein [Cellulomonas sp. URHD0024]